MTHEGNKAKGNNGERAAATLSVLSLGTFLTDSPFWQYCFVFVAAVMGFFLGFGVGLHLYGLGDHEDIAHGHRPGIAVQFEITLLEDVDITGAKGVLVNICSAEKNRLTLECRC